ncbi:MAG: hypothetical protein LYZ70_06605 [Nitrososphaerales archaeon]|nr:hypothetical protein [Nitrososphaerales archaeon]
MSQDNPDIRQQVEASRGPLKKLQLLVPGLRGYRKLEDLRVSDQMLRNQVADRLDRVKDNLQQLRKQVASANDLTNLTVVGSLISQLQALSGEVRHAQQGYSGWVAPIAINDDKLNRLYDYDYTFVSSVFQLDEATAPGKLVYDSAAPNSVQVSVGQLSRTVAEVRQKWSARMEAIEGIAVQGG